jgi:hypothetical protein
MCNLYSYMFRDFYFIVRAFISVPPKLHRFSKLQLLKIKFHKIKTFHIKSRKFLDYGSWIYNFIKLLN